MTTFHFSKYSGCGNDFVLIDNRELSFSPTLEIIKKLCSRHQGIGADGIILLENSKIADFRVRIFNADGSEAEMCGNGMRCYGKFLKELNILGEKFRIEAKEREIIIELLKNKVKIGMGRASNHQTNLTVNVEGIPFVVDYIDTGVPHAVHFVKDIEEVDLATIGPKIRHHPQFQPKGTNFNVATVCEKQIWMRTYERGVEAETMACGTGATAVAIAASQKYGIPSPVEVNTRSGETIEIGFESIDNVTSTGPATFIFRGEFAI